MLDYINKIVSRYNNKYLRIYFIEMRYYRYYIYTRIKE